MMYPPTQETMRPGGIFPGAIVSKGATATFITAVKAMDGLDRSSAEYTMLVNRIREVKPALYAVGLFDICDVRDPEIRAILEM